MSQSKMSLEMITISPRKNGSIPWTKELRAEENEVYEMTTKYMRYFPIFTPKPDGVYPNNSVLDDRAVEDIMYEMQNLADDMDGLWNLFQMKFERPDTGDVWILKMYRTNIGRTRRLEIPEKEGEETIVFDLWGSSNFCLIVKHSRPFAMPMVIG